MADQHTHHAARIVDIDDARRLRAALEWQTTSGEPWLNKTELAQTLRFSVRWVEYRVREGMPHKVIGGRLRFQRSVVEAWLDSREEKRSA